MNKNMKLATFGAGCFWCVEAVFQRLAGVEQIVSGYMGGHTADPTYKSICTGTTGHAEVIQIAYDPDIVGFDTLLKVFWTTHDPTTLNRQGNDRGTQYRSAVFYHDEEQRAQAEHSKTAVAGPLYEDPIVTEISPATTFYPAEKYHQNYYNSNGYAAYCRFVIQPKVAKFRSEFAPLLKQDHA